MRRGKRAPEPATPKALLSAAIKTARDIMRKDAGLNGDLDRIPQFAWILFLKCFDDMEARREVVDQSYRRAIEPPHRWRDWAADSDRGRTGEPLLKFVNDELLPYLRGLTGTGTGDSRDVLASVFKETYSRMLSGYLLRDVVNLVNRINFNSSDDIHTLAHLYESMLREMRDAAGDSGEFYTPRPLIRFIIQQVDPSLGETVLDPAAGTGGFLVESFEHLWKQVKTVEDRALLKERSLFGIEKKPMAYLLGMMNLLLHGIEQPNLRRDNALRNPLTQITDAARYDVIVTNPPFGGEEEKGIQDNFPEATRTSETALLFLQFIMRSLKKGGRCGMVVPDGVLASDGVAARIKEDLLKNFNLHTIVRLPAGVFSPYTTIPSNLLFFDRTGGTKDVWFYEHRLPPDRKNYTKTLPLRFEEFAACQEWWKDRRENDRAWFVAIQAIGDSNFNLDLKHPGRVGDGPHRNPEDVVHSALHKSAQLSSALQHILKERGLYGLESFDPSRWQRVKLRDVLTASGQEEPVDPGRSYRVLGVRLAGGGPFLREVRPGNELAAKTLKRVRAGDLIYSRLFAWRGAFGIIPVELDGAYVSNEFPTFQVDKSQFHPEFLRLYFARPSVWSEVEKYCTGKTKASRNRFKEQFFLLLEVPRPSLNEQDILISVCQTAHVLKNAGGEVMHELDTLIPSILSKAFRGQL